MVWFAQIEFCSWKLPYAYMLPELHLKWLLKLFDKHIEEKYCFFFLTKHPLAQSFFKFKIISWWTEQNNVTKMIPFLVQPLYFILEENIRLGNMQYVLHMLTHQIFYFLLGSYLTYVISGKIPGCVFVNFAVEVRYPTGFVLKM